MPLTYIIKRFCYSVLTLFIIITVTFFLMHAVPGNIYAGVKNLSPSTIKNIKAKYGLDKPLYEQYLIVLNNTVHFDFGVSMKNEGRRINNIIYEHFPKSAALGIFALSLCLIIGIPLGIISALKAGKWQDNVSMIIATIGVAVPSFVIATMTQYFLAVRLKIFPVIGLKSLWHAVLPAIALSFFPLSFVARLMRSSMIEVMKQDYIRTARAKGLPENVVVFRHALKNSILPVVTYMGPLTAGILTGSFVIEKIFNIPGLGRYYVESIFNRDYTTIMGVTVFYAVLLIYMNFIVDIIYMALDPRIKLKD